MDNKIIVLFCIIEFIIILLRLFIWSYIILYRAIILLGLFLFIFDS